uniref:DUF6598 domain-containing protein n=1 Tax=Arundo donax TaxID=35708 RepID=A0A0A9DV86_ARUDO
MESATEALMREGLRKRDHPDPQVESIQIQERQASEDKFWDDLDKQYGTRPVRRDADHAEAKEGWRKTDLVAASKEAAAWWTEEEDDDEDCEAFRFRDTWNILWSGCFGHFEDTTTIPPMRFTDVPPLDKGSLCNTLQFFSVKIAEIGGGLQWPLDVFGLVAIRDSVDRNRNIIFRRPRDDCQTLTEMDPYLVLTGPIRAVVLTDPVTIEVDLKVKGTVFSEEKTLCFLAEELICVQPPHSCLLHRPYTSKFNTLEFTLGHIIFSVEATIFVRVTDGSWPDGFHGQFAACTTSIHSTTIDRDCGDEVPVIGGNTSVDEVPVIGGTTSVDPDCGDEEVPVIGGTTSVDHKRLVLLGFGGHNLPVVHGTIELARRVVSVQVNSKLNIFIKAWRDDNVVEDVAVFTPKEAGRSFGTLEVPSCKMEVVVAWSLVSGTPEPRGGPVRNRGTENTEKVRMEW